MEQTRTELAAPGAPGAEEDDDSLYEMHDIGFEGDQLLDDNATIDRAFSRWQEENQLATPPLGFGAEELLFRDVGPSVRVAAVFGGDEAAAQLSMAAARTLLNSLRTRPHDSQRAELQKYLDEVRISFVV